jgi:signal transduction histidine kinase
MGAWLFGRRDPDDFYPQSDIDLLTTLGNQIAVALETIRFFEIANHRASELERVNFELRRADRLKSDLLRNVTHELKTPLTVIQGYAELMAAEEPLDSEQHEYLAAIVSSAQELTGTVGKLLSQQQQRLRGLEGQLVDINQVAVQAVQRAHILVEKDNLWHKKIHKIVVDVPSDPVGVWADPAQLGQVFDNLLSNAVKFSPGGGTISVRIASGEHDFPQEGTEPTLNAARRPAVFVKVQDNGIGIPSEEIANIWFEFYQVDASSTRHFGGTGLGLALVKDIIDMHGGDVWVESQVGQGSTFTFVLPLYFSTEQETMKRTTPEQTTIPVAS